jgi:hypothetical protein
MAPYRQIVAELRARWGADPDNQVDAGWRVADVDQDELGDYREELVETPGLAGSTINQRRAVLSGVFKVARRASASTSIRSTGSSAPTSRTPAISRSTPSRRSGRSCAACSPAAITRPPTLRPDDVDPDARVLPGEAGGAMDGSAL